MKRRNLELMLAWLDALRRRDETALRAMVDPAVVWQGLTPELVCHGPDDLVTEFLAARDATFEIDALELVAGDGHVVLVTRRPDLHEFEGVALDGVIHNVFTIADGRITRVEDHVSRDAALAAAGVARD